MIRVGNHRPLLIFTVSLMTLVLIGSLPQAKSGVSNSRPPQNPVTSPASQDGVGIDQQVAEAKTELRRGRYAAAIATFGSILRQRPDQADSQEGLLRALIETGQYQQAEVEARRFLTRPGAGVEVSLQLIDVLAATGRDREALPLLESIVRAENQTARIQALLRRGELLAFVGDEAGARLMYESVVNYYEENVVEDAATLTAVARALVNLENYQDANDLYLEAIRLDRQFIDAHLGGGELYTSKYNYSEASSFFADALKINEQSARAHLGTAINRRIGGGDEMNAALKIALKINPNYVEAMALAATLDLEAERFGSAKTMIDQALAINPRSVEVRALRAALYWLQDQPAEMEREVAAVLAINPRYGELYEVIAHFATQTRRYEESVELLRRAVELTPRRWSAWLALGIGLQRIGQPVEGRAAIETSFKGDPFNVWAKNTLDLLDSMKDFNELQRGDFIIRTAPSESEVIAGYASNLLDEVRDKLATRYRFKPRSPITVEIFPNHEDFAVRALGLPGLGALGVCFGRVIVQDSPTARAGSPFNWGSTLWHEFTHVITLQITDHRIPRWFSEGLSVFEEQRARPGWGDDWSPEHIKAFANSRWFRISELDNGFIRPKRPDDIPLAYFQAAQICHFIEDRYGFEAILGMLRGYREKKKTPAILLENLKLDEAEFDRRFNAYVRERIASQIRALADSTIENATSDPTRIDELVAQANSSPDNYHLNLQAGLTLFKLKNYDRAAPLLRRAAALIPWQSGNDNPFVLLARIHLDRGEKAEAAAMLESLIKYDENNDGALRELAALRQESGDRVRALELLELSFFVNPFIEEAHTKAGHLLLELKQPQRAVREFRVALATKPPNLAIAHFNLARALLMAGDRAGAKLSLLAALEIAPTYEEGLDMLLELTEN